MTTVAIHQPNYLPWLGYFHKIAVADVLVFLDDVQFSKNSYTNRVRILADGKARWLTVPVTVHLGEPINRVRPAADDWARRHRDTVFGCYRRAQAFRQVWPRIEDMLGETPTADLAAINRYLVEALAAELALECRFRASSELGVEDKTGDQRLVALVAAVDPSGTYLSGRGGAKYQDESRFAEAGLGFRYAGFADRSYDQGGEAFVVGLSAIDAVMHLGWAGASDLVAGAPLRH